jgi:predicted nucleic acid-binding protein
MIVADTDVLIDLLQGREPAKSGLRAALDRDRIATTVITQFELLAGARQPAVERTIEALLADLDILPLDSTAAALASALHRDLQRGGTGIGMADSLIAGIALSHRALLWTRNRRHFERVADLALFEAPEG